MGDTIDNSPEAIRCLQEMMEQGPMPSTCSWFPPTARAKGMLTTWCYAGSMRCRQCEARCTDRLSVGLANYVKHTGGRDVREPGVELLAAVAAV